MKPSQKLSTRWKSDVTKWTVVAACLVTLVGLFIVLMASASKDEDARKSPAALAFEREAGTWLAHPKEMSEFLEAIAGGQVQAVAVAAGGPLALYTDKQGGRWSASLVPCGSRCSTDMSARLSELSLKHGFVLTIADVDPRSGSQKGLEALFKVFGWLLALSPAMLLLGFMIYQMKGGTGGKADLSARPAVRFDDVIGAESAKKALRRVSVFMKSPEAYAALGSRVPRGVLIEGPPGTGKTLLAKALAGECGANFINIDGSYFSSMFYGAGIGKVKELFKRARKNSPMIIFIDEIDGIGRRSDGGGGAEQEMNRIIDRILVEMDGFDQLDNVVVVGATNHIGNVEPALLRPGRFDLLVKIDLPTASEREAIFALYAGKVKTDASLEIKSLAKMSNGMSPADIANAVNIAGAYAAEAGESTVGMARFVQAIETKQMGGEVTSTNDVITTETRKRLGVHEGGHALVAYLLDAGSVDHISIESREKSLGATYVTRHTEEPLYGERELQTRLAMMLAGREAELLVYGNTSTGAGDDLKRASELAISMVGSMGFGSTIGLLSLAGVPKELLGPDIQRKVLEEARSFLEKAQTEARTALDKHRSGLDMLAGLLVEHGTLNGDPLQTLLCRAHLQDANPNLP